MTTSMPSGDGTVTDAPNKSALDDEAAPSTGPAEGSDKPAPGDRTVLDGPALENEEMRRATDDLRSSQDKTAAARGFADELARTQPGDD